MDIYQKEQKELQTKQRQKQAEGKIKSDNSDLIELIDILQKMDWSSQLYSTVGRVAKLRQLEKKYGSAAVCELSRIISGGGLR